jgi:cytochrome c551
MSIWKQLILIGWIFPLASCNGSPTESSTALDPIVAEQKLYNQHCANCHGGNLQGGFGPALQKAGAKYSEEEILTILQKGKGAMPAQDVIAKEEQQKLAKWISQKKGN